MLSGIQRVAKYRRNAETAVCFVDQGTDNRVGNGIKQPHDRHHCRREHQRETKDTVPVICDIGRGQNIVNICRAVVERKQNQLIGLGPVQRSVSVLFMIISAHVFSPLRPSYSSSRISSLCKPDRVLPLLQRPLHRIQLFRAAEPPSRGLLPHGYPFCFPLHREKDGR